MLDHLLSIWHTNFGPSDPEVIVRAPGRVNIEYIKEYICGEGGSVILTGGQEIEVSRRKKDLLMRKMKEYYKFYKRGKGKKG